MTAVADETISDRRRCSQPLKMQRIYNVEKWSLGIKFQNFVFHVCLGARDKDYIYKE